jgi:hypothetical protein
MDATDAAVGLCHTCRHVRRVENRRGSVFILCEKAATEPERFARYPPLPVRVCPGYTPATLPPHGGEG